MGRIEKVDEFIIILDVKKCKIMKNVEIKRRNLQLVHETLTKW